MSINFGAGCRQGRAEESKGMRRLDWLAVAVLALCLATPWLLVLH